MRNILRIRTNIYADSLPDTVVAKVALEVPSSMSPETLAQELVKRAINFSSYVSPYSFPPKLSGDRMNPGEYNSSSYLAALLKSVMGYVPEFRVAGFQTPGWESPMPLHYWRCVPRAPDLGRRVIYLAVFVMLMMAIGYFMIDVATVLVTLLFGL